MRICSFAGQSDLSFVQWWSCQCTHPELAKLRKWPKVNRPFSLLKGGIWGQDYTRGGYRASAIKGRELCIMCMYKQLTMPTFGISRWMTTMARQKIIILSSQIIEALAKSPDILCILFCILWTKVRYPHHSMYWSAPVIICAHPQLLTAMNMHKFVWGDSKCLLCPGLAHYFLCVYVCMYIIIQWCDTKEI